MKLFIAILVVSLAALSLADFENDRPIWERPGFFNGREQLKPKFDAAAKLSGRITNGNEATPGQFPYMAYLSIATSGGNWFCGASLINAFTALGGLTICCNLVGIVFEKFNFQPLIVLMMELLTSL